MKLKGLLKGFFILGLTLLPISFSSARDFYSPFSFYTRCGWEVDYKISNNGLFTSYYNGIERNKLLYFLGSNRVDCSLKQYIVLGWKNGKLYMFTRNPDGVVNQGYLNHYCYGQEPCTTMNISSDTLVSILNNQGIKGFYQNDLNNVLFPDFGFSNYLNLCFITNSQSVPYLCFYSGYPSNYTFSESLNYNVSDWNDLSSFDGFFDNSPFSYNPTSDIINIWDGTTGTNAEYMSGFEDRGYYKGLCYSDFYTGNLVNSNTLIYELFQGDLDDSTYYGDSVFDFHSSESSTLSLHSWAQQRYNLMKYTYERNDITAFNGYEKGTWNIMFNIYNNHFNDNFSWIDYFTYCKMKVNGYCENCTFTGDVSSGMEDYIERKENEKTFVLSGVDFSGSTNMLNLFNELYTRAKNVFLIDNPNSSVVGILPTYIIFGFFLFLLLYGLRR